MIKLKDLLYESHNDSDDYASKELNASTRKELFND